MRVSEAVRRSVPGGLLRVLALVSVAGCDKAATDWRTCQAAPDHDAQVAACQAAVRADRSSTSGQAAQRRLDEIDDDDERARHYARVAQASRLLAEFRAKENDITDTLDTVPKLSQAGSADLADNQLATAEATIQTYWTTDVSIDPEYDVLRSRVHDAREQLRPILIQWHDDHPTTAELSSKCTTQAMQADAILDKMNASLRRRDYATLNELLPTYDAAIKRWTATFKRFPDPTVGVVMCRAPKR